METVVTQLPGQIYEITQPIQMRFNELISGVRSDLGILVFGEDMDTLADTAAAQCSKSWKLSPAQPMPVSSKQKACQCLPLLRSARPCCATV